MDLERDYNLFLLLVAGTVNLLLRLQEGKVVDLTVELDYAQFLDKVAEISKQYTKEYEVTGYSGSLLTEAEISKLIHERRFAKFLALDDKKDKLIVHTRNYQRLLKDIVIESSINYLKFLVKSIADLEKMKVNSEEQYKVFKEERKKKEAEDGSANDVHSKQQADSKESEDEKTEALLEDEDKKTSDNADDMDVDGKDGELEDEGTSEAEDKEKEEEDGEVDEEEQKNKIVDGSDVIDAVQDPVIEEDKEINDEEEGEEETDAATDAATESLGDNEIKKEEEEDDDDDKEDEIEDADEDVDVEDADDGEESKKTSKKPSEEPKSRKRSVSPSTVQHKRFQSIAVSLLNSIQTHRYSSPFLQPVNPKDAPDYASLIYEPKDLKNIMKAVKLKSDPPEYQLIEQLERDIMLMFANCIMYNNSDTDLVRLTKSMKDDVVNILKLFKEAELDTR